MHVFSAQAYTVVDRRTGAPFVLRSHRRPAVVAFRMYPHALVVAHAVERWQKTHGAAEPMHKLVAAEFTLAEPKNHILQPWDSYAALVASCITEEVDVMFCTYLDVVPDEPIEFIGTLAPRGANAPFEPPP
jgi:hypothetical protein